MSISICYIQYPTTYFSHFSADRCDVADIVFIVDSSGSIQETDTANWGRVLDFIKQVIRKFGATGGDIHFAVVDYSDNAIVEFDLSTYGRDINRIIARIDTITYFQGRTDIADGLQTAREQVFGRAGDRPNAPNLAILLTDGVPNEREADTRPQADLLKTIAKILVVGVTNKIDEQLLRYIATNSRTDYINTPDFAALEGIIDNLVRGACPTLAPVTPRPTPGKGILSFHLLYRSSRELVCAHSKNIVFF